PALTTIYGVPGSGKTCLCIHAALHFLTEGKKILFIDTEKGFSLERFQQLAGEKYTTYLASLILFLPNSFKNQHEIIRQIPAIVNQGNIALVIVDTIGYHYRRFVKNRLELGNTMLIHQMNVLEQISKKIPVIVSNQVYSSVSDNTVKIVGGIIVEKRSDCLIELVKEPRRKIIVKRPEQRELLFTMNDSGFCFL
ncbi:MAG: zonular occludens toxin domain-containing protein, partial [Nanoarchaeota archaeon]